MLLGKVSQLQTAKIEQAIYFIHCFSQMCTMVYIKILHENDINYMWELAYPILTNHTFVNVLLKQHKLWCVQNAEFSEAWILRVLQ